MKRFEDALLLTRPGAERFGRNVLRVILGHIYGKARRTYSGASVADLDRLFAGALPEKGTSPG
ncbi:MAG: hypothetical protein HYS34_06080, partial [Acidobacteria bacterium]|nr:hypothetical protein [Acidobacteriota bacterium]